MDNLVSEDYSSEFKNLIANLVDLGKLKENSIMLLRTPNWSLNFHTIRAIRPLLPKGVLIWIIKTGEDIKIESLSEAEMNQHGWYKK